LTFWIFDLEEGISLFLRNACQHPVDYTMSNLRRKWT
jgi:hypothetical protein